MNLIKKLFGMIGKLIAIMLVLTGVLFVVYITNADSKLVEFVYDKLFEYHATKPVEDKI